MVILHTMGMMGTLEIGHTHMHSCMNAQSLLITYFVCAIRWSVMHSRQSVMHSSDRTRQIMCTRQIMMHSSAIMRSSGRILGV